MALGRDKLHPGQGILDFDHTGKPATAPAVVKSSRSQVIVDTIRAAYQHLGFNTVDDEAFFQLVLARLNEPTSKSDSVRVLSELGVDTVHRNTFLTCLKRARDHNYRDQIAAKCFDYSVATTGIRACLLYWRVSDCEAEPVTINPRHRVFTDEQWERIEPLLPSNTGNRARPFENNPRIVEGIAYRHRTGIA